MGMPDFIVPGPIIPASIMCIIRIICIIGIMLGSIIDDGPTASPFVM
jgi:hypothetical protein